MLVALFIGRRIVALVATLLVASVIIFGALALAPGDPATLLAGGGKPNPALIASVRAEYHLDDPFVSQYWRWLTHAVRGDFGQSIVFRDSVDGLIAARATTTLMLVTYAALLILGLGISLGVAAALRGGAVGTGITTLTTLAMATPTFVMSILLIWLFSTQLSWFPVFGAGSGFGDRVRHLTLPAVALALTYIAYVARITRTSVATELDSEHVATARTRGLAARLIVRRHVLRNASAPILNVTGLTVAGLIAGTAVAEQAFGISGIGQLLVDSASRRDLGVVQAIALLMVTAFVVSSTVVDVVSATLDPRLARRGAA